MFYYFDNTVFDNVSFRYQSQLTMLPEDWVYWILPHQESMLRFGRLIAIVPKGCMINLCSVNLGQPLTYVQC